MQLQKELEESIEENEEEAEHLQKQIERMPHINVKLLVSLLSTTNLNNTNLYHANLREIKSFVLRRTVLSKADQSNAKPYSVDLRYVKLRGALLVKTDMTLYDPSDDAMHFEESSILTHIENTEITDDKYLCTKVKKQYEYISRQNYFNFMIDDK